MLFTILHQGRVDCLASWFTLHLDSEHCLSTSPSADTSWEQAIFPITMNEEEEEEEEEEEALVMSIGQVVPVRAGCTESQLIITTNSKSKGDITNPSTATSTNVASADGSPSVLPYYIERNELLRLNDEVYTERILNALRSFQFEEEDEEETTVLDITDLPLVMLLVASEGAATEGVATDEGNAATNKSSIDYVVLGNVRAYYQDLVTKLVESHGLKEMVSLQAIIGAPGIANGALWDIIVCEMITPQGTLDTQSIQLLRLMRYVT